MPNKKKEVIKGPESPVTFVIIRVVHVVHDKPEEKDDMDDTIDNTDPRYDLPIGFEDLLGRLGMKGKKQ